MNRKNAPSSPIREVAGSQIRKNGLRPSRPKAKNAWITQGGGNYFVEFYLGTGTKNLRVRISKAIAEKLVKAKLFKVVGNRWGGKEVTLTFETPVTAQRFQEAVAVDDLVSVPKRR